MKKPADEKINRTRPRKESKQILYTSMINLRVGQYVIKSTNLNYGKKKNTH